MVKFAKALVAARRQGWEDHYIDYKELKRALKQLAGEASEERALLALAPTSVANPMSPAAASASSAREDDVVGRPTSWTVRTSADFADVLDGEIEKVVLFFLQAQGRLATTMADLLQRWPHHEELAAGCRGVGVELVELLRFLELNNTGLRKILKKHDKMIDSQRITGSFLSSRAARPDSHLRHLSRHEGLNSLLTSVRSGLNAAANAAKLERAGAAQQALSQHEAARRSPLADADAGADTGADPTESPRSAAARVFYRRFLRGGSFDEGEPVLRRIESARRRLHAATGFLSPTAYLAHVSGLGMRAMPSLLDESSSDAEGESRAALEPRLSGWLNLLSTFLYMMNYYIVLPTSADYAARVHMPEAFSGVIVGCTPIAACLSAFVYSFWTNRSFRKPLLACSLLLVLGNLLYVLALPLGAFWPILLGRFVNGCGGARGINRRYIADTVPVKRRTVASAAFVTAGALGMAAGPGVAAAINAALAGRDVLLPLPGGFVLIFDSVTAPGFFMAALWLVYFCVLLVGFKEPEVCLRRAREHSARKARPPSKLPLLAQPQAHYGSVQRAPPTPDGAAAAAAAAPKAKGICAVLGSNRATLFCLLCYFVLKLVQEGLLTSTPLLTAFYFGWDATASGCFLTVLGSLTLPLNYLIGYVSRTRDDRYLAAIMQSFVILGLVVLLFHSRGGAASLVAQFCAGGIIVFSASSMLEGVTMSLLSKVVPASLASGVFNAGLLATEAGTLGRACGDFIVTGVGASLPLGSFLTALQVPNLVLSVAMLMLLKRLYPVLY